jgi:predicted transcriptional regulator
MSGKTWAVRIPDDLRPHICEIARQRCRTPGGQVTFWIERALAAEATAAGKKMAQHAPHDALTASLMKINGDQ